MRARAHGLGTVAAPDQKSAEAEAVKAFGLSEDQRKRAYWSGADRSRLLLKALGAILGR
jgi:hypothetical protein